MPAIRINAAAAVAVLALGGAGVALGSSGSRAGAVATTPPTVRVTLREGKPKAAPASIGAGKITLVANNAGKKTHALAIMGAGLAPKRTPALRPGKRASMTVVLQEGTFMIWDPIRGSMSNATMLVVRARTDGGTTGGGTTGGGGVVTPTPTTTTPTTTTTTPPTTTTPTMTNMDGGMDGC